MGKADHYVHGDHNAQCFECGRKFKASTLKKHWQGYWVCLEHWEPRHTQDFVRSVPDIMTPPWAQPQPASATIYNTSTVLPATTLSSISYVGTGTITLTLPVPIPGQVIIITNAGAGLITVAGGAIPVGTGTTFPVPTMTTARFVFDGLTWLPVVNGAVQLGTRNVTGATIFSSAVTAQAYVTAQLALLSAGFAAIPPAANPIPGALAVTPLTAQYVPVNNMPRVTYTYALRTGALNVFHLSVPGYVWNMNAYGITILPAGVDHSVGTANIYSLTSYAAAKTEYYSVFNEQLPATLPEVHPFYGTSSKDNFFTDAGGALGFKYASTNPTYNHSYGPAGAYTTNMTAEYYVDLVYTVV